MVNNDFAALLAETKAAAGAPALAAVVVGAHAQRQMGAVGVRRRHTSFVAGKPVGAGWGVQTLAGQTVSAHVGGAGTFVAVGAVSHERDLAVGIAANAGQEATERAVIVLLKTLLAA
jgi:hypothetical protein